ncbi:hypothetical protein WR25_24309 [Diploscapter pachys]|uniref:Uncharacterized protein n=1 Tax=Diploscapter pachys TaxID=2018661 RepID=A0A2A2LRA0_9BILA|nr:hypothetical protein WR25_24309 [Diploscapter pachys]
MPQALRVEKKSVEMRENERAGDMERWKEIKTKKETKKRNVCHFQWKQREGSVTLYAGMQKAESRMHNHRTALPDYLIQENSPSDHSISYEEAMKR